MQARELVPVMGEQRGKLLFTGYAPRDLKLAAHLRRGVEKRDVMTACGGGECEPAPATAMRCTLMAAVEM